MDGDLPYSTLFLTFMTSFQIYLKLRPVSPMATRNIWHSNAPPTLSTDRSSQTMDLCLPMLQKCNLYGLLLGDFAFDGLRPTYSQSGC